MGQTPCQLNTRFIAASAHSSCQVIVTYLLAKSDKPTSQLRVLDGKCPATISCIEAPPLMRGLVGAKEVVSRLAAPISTVRTSTAVVSVAPKAGSVEITYRKVDDASEAVAKEVFQHVIIATQGTVMLYLWPSPGVALPALPFLSQHGTEGAARRG